MLYYPALILRLFIINLKIIWRYRNTLLVSLLLEPLAFLITAVSLSAIYRNQGGGDILGFGFKSLLWYFAGITLIWFCVWNSADTNISRKILSGELSTDLLRPVSLHLMEFISAAASRVAALVLEFLPAFLVFSLIARPDFLTLPRAGQFCLLAAGSFVLYFHMNFLLGLFSLFIKSNLTIQSLKFVVITLTSGALIPLEFYPGILRGICKASPFAYIFYWPLQYLSGAPGSAVSGAFLVLVLKQGAWSLLFFFLAVIGYRISIRKYCAAGG